MQWKLCICLAFLFSFPILSTGYPFLTDELNTLGETFCFFYFLLRSPTLPPETSASSPLSTDVFFALVPLALVHYWVGLWPQLFHFLLSLPVSLDYVMCPNSHFLSSHVLQTLFFGHQPRNPNLTTMNCASFPLTVGSPLFLKLNPAGLEVHRTFPFCCHV